MLRSVRVLGPAALVAVALVALMAALAVGGGAAPLALGDPGPVVRYALPVARLLMDLSFSLTLGSLVLAVFAMSPKQPEYGKTLDIVAGAAAVWTVSVGATAFLTFLSVTGLELSSSDTFGSALAQFLTSIDLGTSYFAVTIIAAATTVAAFAIRAQPGVFALTILVGWSAILVGQQGHAAGAGGHDVATTALTMHLVGAAVWVGGLALLPLLRRSLGDRLPVVLARYSSVALVCFVIVAVSGTVSAYLRVGTAPNLLTPYGILVVVKVVALTALAGFGVLQRRWIIRRLEAGTPKARGLFWWLVVAELAVMGVASGVAAALGRTAPPIDDAAEAVAAADGSPAQILTGESLPPNPDVSRWLTEWKIDPLFLTAIGFAIAFYLLGVIRLHRRGDRWPVHRTVLWITGMLVLAVILNGSIAVYEKYLFSFHMAGHMALTMLVPLLLVPAAPITLALRAIAKRDDGSRGGREWILAIVQSRFVSVVSHPIVAAVLFAGSLWAFYYTPLFDWAVTDHWGHVWMVLHFLITGYLFVQALIGIDPLPHRASYPLRLMLLIATMAFHAFFGLAIMTGEGLLLADWYGAMGWDIGVSALQDQQIGGGIAWSIGEIPTVALAVIVAIEWGRDDKREQKRRDRNADRTGDAELVEYNRMLQRLQDRKAPGDRS